MWRWAHKFEELAAGADALAQAEALGTGHEVEVLNEAEVGIEDEELGHIADAMAIPLRPLGGVLIEDAHSPLVRGVDAIEEADNGGLPGTTRSDETVDGAAFDVQADVVDDVVLAKAFGDVLHLDDIALRGWARGDDCLHAEVSWLRLWQGGPDSRRILHDAGHGRNRGGVSDNGIGFWREAYPVA